jgi:hypothetical protein
MTTMKCSKKSLAILLCLFLIAFKVAAASVFIDAAIERAQMHQSSSMGDLSNVSHVNNDGGDSEGQSNTLFLMSHVTGNVSEAAVIISFVPLALTTLIPCCSILHTQNFPDSDFKPPKIAA